MWHTLGFSGGISLSVNTSSALTVPDSGDEVTNSRSRCLRAGKKDSRLQNTDLQRMKVTLTNKKGLLTPNQKARC